MSLLFTPPQPLFCTFTICDSEQDVLVISPDIWNRLSEKDGSDRIALSIITSQPNAKPLSCWATQNSETGDLAVPSRWLHQYPDVFPRHVKSSSNALLISRVNHVPLTEVIVSALGSDAYNLATSPGLVLQKHLSQDKRLLRQGDILTLSSEDLPLNGHGSSLHSFKYEFRVELTAPVLQGYAEEGRTSIVVLEDHPEVTPDEDQSSSSYSSETESEMIEIDEAFLASSLSSTLRPAKASPSPLTTALVNGCPLRSPLNLQDDYSVFLRSTELARLGALHGDWIVIKGEKESRSRLARAYVSDGLQVLSVSASPTLIYNVCRNPFSSGKILLESSPFGSQDPPVPTARSVTIARIASPLSINKRYQSLFLAALKGYFESGRRMVKSGDILALPIDVSLARDLDEEDAHFLQSSHSASSGDTVFFLVTNVELESTLRSLSPMPQDVYANATTGELGCWVDSANTRVVQTGLEQARVPDLGTYFGDTTANLSTQKALTREDGPIGHLFSLVSAALLQNAQRLSLHLSLLLTGARGIGKFTAVKWVSRVLGLHLFEINIFDIIGDTATKTEGALRARFEQSRDCAPCLIVLRHVDALTMTTQTLEPGKEVPLATALKECLSSLHATWKATGYPAIVIGTTGVPDLVPVELLSEFKHSIKLEVPNEAERLEILTSLTREQSLSLDVSLESLAAQTAGLVASDLASLVTRTKVKATEKAMELTRNSGERDLFCSGLPLASDNFDAALGQARAVYSEVIGAPKIPNVSWDDVGGLAHVKSDILDTIQLPLEHPELFSDGLKKRSGILLYGPPGTGKTLLAKAVATSCSLNFFSVKGPELINMYIGESEANVRRVFQRARDARPCVIFFDELDSIAPKRGNTGDSGGVMDRIVSQLLAELDGMSSASGTDVFVMGATNRPDLLDPALLRPGRFDRMLYLGVSETTKDRLNILEALTRKFKLHPDLSMERFAENCPPNYTGADFYALCSDAILNAMSRKAEEVDNRIATLNTTGFPSGRGHPHPVTPQYYLSELSTASEIEVLVDQGDFEIAMRNLRPSVSASEMEHYKTVQQRFQSQSVTKGKSKGKGKASNGYPE